MKQFLNIFTVALFSFQSSWAQVLCSTAIGKESTPIAKKISNEQATEWAKEFIEKKMLFSNVQFISILAAHPSNSDNVVSVKTLPSGEEYNYLQDAVRLNNLIDPVEIRQNKDKQSAARTLTRPQDILNQQDQVFFDDWTKRSVDMLESLVMILEFPKERRERVISNIQNSFAIQDSKADIINTLKNIRDMKAEDPDKYEAFIRAWKATIPQATQMALQSVKTHRHSDKELAKWFTLGTGGTVAALLYTMGLSVDAVAAGVLGGGLGSALGGALFADSHLFAHLRDGIRNLSAKTFKIFTTGKVRKLAKKALGLNAAEAEKLTEINTSKERRQLDELQDLTLPELVEAMKLVQTIDFSDLAQLRKFQRQQVYMMTELSNQFSILSERQENISKNMDQFIKDSETASKLAESEKREKIKEITQLQSDIYEYSLDVNSLDVTVKKIAEAMNSQLEVMNSALAQNPSREAKVILQQLIMQAQVIDGMEDALFGLNGSIQKDVEMIGQLSLGIMAGQVSETMKSLSRQGRKP